MIREILEQNVKYVVWHEKFNKTTNQIMSSFKLDGKWHCGTDENYDMSTELACRQYVKKNGFKLEWFDDDYDEFENLSYNLHWHCRMGKEKQTKLIAWLYANDIEIKE